MSDIEHIRGILKPTNKTIEQYIGDVNLESWNKDARYYFEDELYRKATEINGFVYEVMSEELDPYDDIYRAKLNSDGTIDFEVKFYNGGCSFSEALYEALEPISTQHEPSKAD